jgi:hypothetical protein
MKMIKTLLPSILQKLTSLALILRQIGLPFHPGPKVKEFKRKGSKHWL